MEAIIQKIGLLIITAYSENISGKICFVVNEFSVTLLRWKRLWTICVYLFFGFEKSDQPASINHLKPGLLWNKISEKS